MTNLFRLLTAIIKSVRTHIQRLMVYLAKLMLPVAFIIKILVSEKYLTLNLSGFS